MKKVLFVINTLGGAGAERALLELLKRFTPDQYEVDLYILLEQGELISQVPEYVNILNRDYTAESVLSAEGKKKLNKKVFMRLFTHGKLPDIVLGSRFMEGSSGFSVSFAKKIAFVWFRIMLKTGTGRRITDPTTGLQGLNWRTFLFYSKYNNFDDKYPDANMLMQMLLLGFRVREIPAVMHVRTTGVSMHSGLKPVLYMFRMTFSILAVWIREKILKMDEDKIHELEKYDE